MMKVLTIIFGPIYAPLLTFVTTINNYILFRCSLFDMLGSSTQIQTLLTIKKILDHKIVHKNRILIKVPLHLII